MKPGPIGAANGPVTVGVDGISRDADGNPVIYQERYGLHEINGVLRLNPAVNARDKDVVACEKLLAAARSELEAAGEQTDLTIIMIATKGEPGPFPTGALYQWFGELFARRGFGPLYLAAHFLVTWQLTRVVAAEDWPLEVKTEWLGRFGESYGRWSEEHSKKHEAILKVQRVAAGSMKGAKQSREQAENRYSVIAAAAGPKIDDGLVTSGQLAIWRFEDINDALELAGFEKISNHETMEKTINRVRETRGYLNPRRRERRRQPPG
jgi:hypothetical protein